MLMCNPRTAAASYRVQKQLEDLLLVEPNVDEIGKAMDNKLDLTPAKKPIRTLKDLGTDEMVAALGFEPVRRAVQTTKISGNRRPRLDLDGNEVMVFPQRCNIFRRQLNTIKNKFEKQWDRPAKF